MGIDEKKFKEHFSKMETVFLEFLLKQYEWEVENYLARHDIPISALKEVIKSREECEGCSNYNYGYGIEDTEKCKGCPHKKFHKYLYVKL